MKKGMLCGLLLGVALAVAARAADKIQPLDVKLGLWEATIKIQSNGGMPISPALLARLTPEQRARIEERLKAQSGASPRTITYKTCLTKEKRDQERYGLDKQGCTQTIITSTSTKLVGKTTCLEQGTKLAGTLELEATSREHVKGTMHMTATGDNGAMKVDDTYDGKWVGASCGNVD